MGSCVSHCLYKNAHQELANLILDGSQPHACQQITTYVLHHPRSLDARFEYDGGIYTPLMLACRFSHHGIYFGDRIRKNKYHQVEVQQQVSSIQIVSTLIALMKTHNYDINKSICVNYGSEHLPFYANALMCAVAYSGTTSNLDTVKLLIDEGAYIDGPPRRHSTDRLKYTPLMMGIEWSESCDIETIRYLIEQGANVNISVITEVHRKRQRLTALDIARRSPTNSLKLEAIRLLTEYMT